MSGIPLVWVTGATCDDTVRVDALLRREILTRLKDIPSLPGLDDALAVAGKDYEIRCDDPDVYATVRETARASLNGAPTHMDLGGSPAISTMAGLFLGADAYYAGNIGRSVDDVLRSHYVNHRSWFVDGNPLTQHHPGTLSLELDDGTGKVMFSHAQGRSVREMDLQRFWTKISTLYGEREKLVLALGGLSKGEPSEYASLARTVKARWPSVRLFVGTNSFGNRDAEEKARQYWNAIMIRADIISCNESEAQILYRALGGDGQATMIDVLRYLDKRTPAQVVIHSAAGAIATSNGFSPEDVSSALELAVSGASYRFATGGYGTRSQITDFSESNGRAYSLFARTMGVLPESVEFPYAVAHDLTDRVHCGSVTGAGATFDGTLLVELAPLFSKQL